MKRDDKELTKVLTNLGLSWEHARAAVGVILEERMTADRTGYERGYIIGHKDGQRDALRCLDSRI